MTQNGSNRYKNGKISDSKRVNDHYAKYLKSARYEKPSFIQVCMMYLAIHLTVVLALIKEKLSIVKVPVQKHRKDYSELFNLADRFVPTHFYPRFWDVFARPTTNLPCDSTIVLERKMDFNTKKARVTGNSMRCLNLASFNYLGVSQNEGPSIDATEKSFYENGLVTSSTLRELGRTKLHVKLEKLTAQFLGAEAVLSFGMGFATNTLNMPSIITEGCLVASDAKNHASMILGLRNSGATVKVFKHNDMRSLEKVLKDGICNGQPNGDGSWNKIFIVTEGIFSMEGTIVNLPEIISLKKKYKAYLYIDEAHSIGAVGENGRGVTDYFNCDPNDIDIWMGTYSKGFSSFGGFIAGSRKLINFLRNNSQGAFYSSPVPLAVIPKIMHTLNSFLDGTRDGQRRVLQLKRNTNYLRSKLGQLGIVVYGHHDSPIVPMIFFCRTKLIVTLRTLLEKYKIAAVGVAYPAIDIYSSRLRICLSAAHTKAQIDYFLNAIEEISNHIRLDYSSHVVNKNEEIEY
uniref:serine C-palmitoyltransferase n=1 Tax=Culicoides sonorensis TaxID=179676 RepID=A0A336KS50_CULSO